MKEQLLFIFSILIFFSSYAQEDCYLGIGGKDDVIITEVFELTEEQTENLKNWGAELKFRNEIFELKANNLLKNHAQASPEDLLKMSYNYKALLDSMAANMRLLDKRMLGTFTNKQYNVYIMLCNQLSRSPIYTSRSVNE
ncbi:MULTISPECIES: hypothetical protein [Croceitalea]|uniref:Uncharacterized protein n=1 Tax=Croceitalea vernalis TaxID=3075599 RepID=A0ABU3BJ27_9FLAO|nr:MULTISPECIES: hypothetical protein [unclassified Croceitalea]MDT0540326.1 hypothetical protein [Croceitalea sp. P059]MDT0622161.1 hypothetical protein [Croceitalea sp. P007]